MADDGLDAGAFDGADPLPYVNRREAPSEVTTFWVNWVRTQRARHQRLNPQERPQKGA